MPCSPLAFPIFSVSFHPTQRGCKVSDKLKGRALLRAAMRNRKTAAMLVLGFASGLPFVLLIGTLNAWLGELKVSLATIGVLSWIGLAYAFKFLWSPLVDRARLPLIGQLGRRRSWLVQIG